MSNFKLKILSILKKYGFFNNLSDENYLKMIYKAKFDKKLDLNNPKTFNEKLQWLKLNDRKDIYTTMVDKYECSEYVKKIIGEEYIIPIIGIYDSINEIDFNSLPNQFVMKCTHDSGGIVICKDKTKLDINEARKKIEKCLKRDYYKYGREWPYKNVKPRIIIEKYMVDESKKELKDYKIFCFNGKPELIMVDSGRYENHIRNVYDVYWNKIDININFPSSSDFVVKKPDCLEKMLELSKILSKNIPFIRTDFYIINEKIYFGELTFFPGSGLQIITPEIWQRKLGNLIDLDLVKKNEK